MAKHDDHDFDFDSEVDFTNEVAQVDQVQINLTIPWKANDFHFVKTHLEILDFPKFQFC